MNSELDQKHIQALEHQISSIVILLKNCHDVPTRKCGKRTNKISTTGCITKTANDIISTPI